MLIKIKKNRTLIYKKYQFKCALGKKGVKKNKKEGDKATPKGTFCLGKIYYRSDRIKRITAKLKTKIIKKNLGWCNDPNNKNYNREIKLNSRNKGEKLFRNDRKYDALIVINYNVSPAIPNKGSAIFLHITRNYKSTAGCISINLKNFLTLVKLINKNTKIKIY